MQNSEALHIEIWKKFAASCVPWKETTTLDGLRITKGGIKDDVLGVVFGDNDDDDDDLYRM